MNTQRLTPEELAAIRERAEKATPGPWRVKVDRGIFDMFDVMNSRDITIYNIESDARFAAHAREDIPRLLGALDAAYAEIERLQKRWVYAIENAEHMADVLVPQDLSDFYSDVARYLRRIERESDAE